VEAHPGYFAITLNTTVRAEMTVSNHTALYRFTFPEIPLEPNTPLSPLILADLADLPNSRSSGAVSVDPVTGRITGNGTFSPSFGIGAYDLHFCADFSGQLFVILGCSVITALERADLSWLKRTE
jgi:hypothetical protein